MLPRRNAFLIALKIVNRFGKHPFPFKNLKEDKNNLPKLPLGLQPTIGHNESFMRDISVSFI